MLKVVDYYSNIYMAKEVKFNEKRWQAEMDADTMARYEEIMADKARVNAAIKVAREKASDLSKRANAMSRVAGNKPVKKK